MDWFKKRMVSDFQKAAGSIDEFKKLIESDEPKLTESDEAKPAEKWIWVDGYKATDKDMKCRDYPFELNKCFDISDDREVELCAHGFHLCVRLHHVFNYYRIGDGHRFFKVKALVRAKDYENLGRIYIDSPYHFGRRFIDNDKLAAKSIIFTQELTTDEILHGRVPNDWTDEEKRLALEIGVEEATHKITFEKLVALGYSNTFAQLCIDEKRDKVALSVGSQADLSMDMKAYLIFNINNNVRK